MQARIYAIHEYFNIILQMIEVRGLFSTDAFGALAPAILGNILLSAHIIQKSKIVHCIEA